jgi:hypothetical protein
MEPSLKNGKKEALDILDQQVSQQELKIGSGGFMKTIEGLPWWSKYAKSEVTRRRLLNGESLFSQIPNKSRKRPQTSIEEQRSRREGNRLLDAYDAQMARQNAEKVRSPSRNKRKTTKNHGRRTTPGSAASGKCLIRRRAQ